MDAHLSARKLAITIYASQTNPAPIKETHTSFDKLAVLLEHRTVRKDKLGHRAFGPYKLHTPHRYSNNVEYFSMAVADVDDGIPFTYLHSVLDPYAWIAHSSHSHTPEEPRYRIIIPLSRDVRADEWPRFWKGFAAFLQGHVDPATKDLARLFFLPSCPQDTAHHAFYEVHQGAMLDPDPIIALVPPEMPKRLDSSAPKAANAFAGAIEYPTSYADVVAEHCAVIRWFKETGAPSEPLWHKCVGVLKHCADGEAKIHEWSSSYEDYSAGETQQKIDNWTAGPSTCEVIKTLCEGRCDNCTHTCKSPVQLGQIIESKPVRLDEIEETPISETVLTQQELIDRIWHKKVEKRNDGMYFKITEEDGTVTSKEFSKTVFYPTDLVRNEEGEWEMVLEYVTQYGKTREFHMPTNHLAAMDRMAGTLAAHTIFIEGKQGRVFTMEHLKAMVLGLQSHRKEVITEEAFGWTKEGDGFIIGNTMATLDKDKDVKLSEHLISGGMARDYGVSGSRDDWSRLVNAVYNRPGAEMYQFAFLVAAASPLISLVGIDGFHGLPVAYTGDGGRGKTTTCELACSIWGKGELFKQSSNKGGSTINGLIAKTAIYRHLPFVMDELTGQDIKEIGDMLYALSNGQNKVRLGPSGSFAGKALHWDLFSFVTGNMDVTGLLATLDRQMAEAVSVRCFEVKVPPDINETVFQGVNFKQLVDIELRQNYGVVGRVLLKAYMKNRDKIVAAVHRMRQQYQPNTADETRERFYIDMICFALVAGKIMVKLGLVNFDIDNIRTWAFKNIKSLRRARTERQVTSGDIVGEFISSLHDHTIITKNVLDLRNRGQAEVPIDQSRGEPFARKATEAKRFFISATALRTWSKENHISPSALREALDSEGYIVHVKGRGEPSGAFNFRLGQGTTRTTGLARCFELDYAKVHGFDAAESDNVVSMIKKMGSEVVFTEIEGVA